MLKELFHAVAHPVALKWEHHGQLKKLIAAIRAQDVPAIEGILSGIERLDKFKGRTTSARWESFFNTSYASRLLEEAIATDNPAVMQALQDINRDPNHRLSYWYVEPLAGCIDGSFSLIHRAIEDGRRNMALFLARQPDFDVMAAGGNKGSAGVLTGVNDETFEAPLEQARARGVDMSQVTAALAARMEEKLKELQVIGTAPPAPRP